MDAAWELSIADDDLLFHYTSSQNALNFILREKKIRFTPFGKLKDPRESKKWSFDILGGGSNMKEYISKQGIIRNEFNDFIKKKCKVLCLCSKGNDEVNLEGNAIPEYRKPLCIAGFTKSRMWAQYASSHKGICFVFSKKALESQLAITFLDNKKYYGLVTYQYHLESFVRSRKVAFIPLIKDGVDKILKDQIDKFHHEYFFLKLMDYRDESEYRFVVVVENNDGYVYMPIESVLKGVILGVDFPKKKYKDVLAMINGYDSKVSVRVLDWQEGRPQLMDDLTWFDHKKFA